MFSVWVAEHSRESSVRCEPLRLFKLRLRFATGSTALQRQRELVACLRAVRRQTNRLAESFDRASDIRGLESLKTHSDRKR